MGRQSGAALATISGCTDEERQALKPAISIRAATAVDLVTPRKGAA